MKATDETKELIANLTSNELLKAIEDLDNKKHVNSLFTTHEQGNNYNFVSPMGNYYGPKRIIECALLNKGYVANYNEFTSNTSLRNRIKKATGYKLVEGGV